MYIQISMSVLAAMVDVHTNAATLMAVLCAVVTLGMSWALMEWLAMVHRLCVCIFNFHHFRYQ